VFQMFRKMSRKRREMKRSEMIERLTCFLSEEQGYREDRSYAEMIIVFLESQGMQPPQYFGHSSFLQWDIEKQECVPAQRRCLQNAWEPEQAGDTGDEQ